MITLDDIMGDKNKEETKIANAPKARTIERKTKHIYRRAFSETVLLDLVPGEMKEGCSYHFLTGGDIDGLTYLKLITRKQNVEYCLLSTWCMAAEDVYQIEEWLKTGLIKKMDCYVGEIFPTSYKSVYELLKKVMEKYNGKLVVFRNHSKIFAGYGDKFYFGIESSANLNTNPRTENGCITIDKGIFEFYYNYFNGINSFIKEGE